MIGRLLSPGIMAAFTCKETTHTNTHFEVNVFAPLSYENSFLMTSKHKNVDHNQPFPSKNSQIGDVNGTDGTQKNKLIKALSIHSLLQHLTKRAE